MRSSMFARRTAVLGAGIIVPAVIVACATVVEPAGDAVVVSSDASSEATVHPPDGTDESDETSAADGATPCSPGGWCPTTLPGTNIWVTNVMPLEKRAFAIINGLIGEHRIAEWTPEDGWTVLKAVYKSNWPSVVSDGDLWAPDEDTVYFAVRDNSRQVSDTFGAIVVRGRRPVAPATEWTWTQSRISCGRQLLGAAVGGTKDGNVYLATCGKIFRLDTSADAGAASDGDTDAGAETLRWIDEGFVDVDPTIPLDFFEIGGTGPDDLWFAGGRFLSGSVVSCAVVVHKTSDGYRTVMDGIPQTSGCFPRGDVPMLQGALNAGMHAFSKNRLIAAVPTVTTSGTQAPQLVKIGHFGDPITVQTAEPPGGTTRLASPWVTSEDDLFVIADNAVSYGSFILRGRSLWGDNPSYDFSQLAINGVRNTAILKRMRGTSNQNLWAVGAPASGTGGGYAYHKTTP